MWYFSNSSGSSSSECPVGSSDLIEDTSEHDLECIGATGTLSTIVSLVTRLNI